MSDRTDDEWRLDWGEFLSEYERRLEAAEAAQLRIIEAADRVIADSGVNGNIGDEGQATTAKMMAIAAKSGATEERMCLAARLHDIESHPELIGVCSECGAGISPNRLLANLTTTRCIECKKKGGFSSRAHSHNAPRPRRQQPPGVKMSGVV